MVWRILSLVAVLSGVQAIRLAGPTQTDIDGCTDPIAKCVIRAMDKIIADHVAWDDWEAWEELMLKFFTPDMIYDSNYSPNSDLGNSTGIREWFDREHIPYNLAFDNTTFNQMIFASEDTTATTTTYAKATWKGDLATIPGSKLVGKEVTMRIYDFYIMEGEKIFYNWMLLDTVGLMLEAGYRVLPKAPLRENWVLPPRAMDGIPAPISRLVNKEHSEISKMIVREVLENDLVSGNAPSIRWTDDMTWYGCVGFGMATNKDEYNQHFLQPFWEALSERSLDVIVLSCEGAYCGVTGWIEGRHTGSWLGEEATNELLRIRFGFHYRVDVHTETVPEGYAMFDLPGAFIQMGVDLYARMTPEYAVDQAGKDELARYKYTVV